MSKEMEALGQQIAELLRVEAVAFIDGNKEDVFVLGNDLVNAVLAEQVFKKIPIAKLPKGATPEEIAGREALLAEHARVFQLVATAQREHNARITKLRKNAASTAGKVAGVLAGIGVASLRGLILKV